MDTIIDLIYTSEEVEISTTVSATVRFQISSQEHSGASAFLLPFFVPWRLSDLYLFAPLPDVVQIAGRKGRSGIDAQ